LQVGQCPAAHEQTGIGAHAQPGRQLATHVRAAGSVRSPDPPGQQEAAIREASANIADSRLERASFR
jgi:hypothetical protein